MIKKILTRFMNGFCYSIGITLTVHALIMFLSGSPQLLPEFVAHFNSETTAYIVEMLLIGLMSGITSAGTNVLDARKIGMVLQSVLFIAIMLSAWIPVACFVWGFHKYTGSMISTTCAIIVTYGISRWLQYRQCKRDIETINNKLEQRKA